MICLCAPSPVSSTISASEIKFLLPVSFIVACFHIYESPRKASRGFDSFSEPISQWNPKLRVQERGIPGTAKLVTAHFKTLNTTLGLGKLSKIRSTSVTFEGAAGLMWSTLPHPSCHSKTPTTVIWASMCRGCFKPAGKPAKCYDLLLCSRCQLNCSWQTGFK